jgi:single-strand DNA-binding protein
MITSQIIGHLTRDPQLHTFGDGGTVVSFGVASSNTMTAKDTEPQATFVDCKLFGKAGEVFMKHHSKGSKCFVAGTLQEVKWTGKDGSTGKKLEMSVNNWTFAGAPKVADAPTPAQPVLNTAGTTSGRISTAKPNYANAASLIPDDYDPFESE